MIRHFRHFLILVNLVIISCCGIPLVGQQTIISLPSADVSMSQSNGDEVRACPVQMPIDPQQVSIFAHPNFIQNTRCLYNSKPWNNPENASQSDDVYSEVILDNKKQTDCLYFSDFQLNIPQGANIEGIELWVEGHVEGDPINAVKIQLTNEKGKPITPSKARTGRGKVWDKGVFGEDKIWSYGKRSDTWSKNWTSEILNSPDFGVSIRLRQAADSTHSIIRIDQVRLQVYYTPLHRLCHDSCNIFLVDPISEVIAYLWELPTGAFINSDDPYKNTITVNIDDLSPGIHEICVRSMTMTTLSEPCCMKFVKGDCMPSSIGNFVWNDANINGIQEPNEKGLASIPVKLFDASTQKMIADTITDSLGLYQFVHLDEGHYYLEFTPPTDWVASLRFAGAKNQDNDVSNVNGRYITNPFFLSANTTNQDIDAGFNEAKIQTGAIGNYVWLDRDDDGIQDIFEDGINGVTLALFKDNHEFVAATITQNDSLFRPGFYLFDDLDPGNYYIIALKNNRDFKFSIPHAKSNDKKDSDITHKVKPGSTDLISIGSGEMDMSIDIGLVLKSTLGDYIWEDSNNNGIQDSTESGINGIVVNLFNDKREQMYSTITAYDSTLNKDGYYFFDDLVPGGYFIQLELPQDHEISISNVGGNDAIDNDINSSNGPASSFIFYLSPGEHERDIDGGIYKTSSLGSLVWLDQNTNGMKDDDEIGVEDVVVSIYTLQGSKLSSTYTDNEGKYGINQLPQGDYYLKFDAPDEYDFTKSMTDFPNENSDVNHEFGYGTTKAININTNQKLMHIDAGLQDNLVLAIYFIDFDVYSTQNGIGLNWEVDDAQDVEQFVILRRSPNESIFTAIDQITLSSSTMWQTVFNYLDEMAIQGIQYDYRIKSIESDGSIRFSPIKSINASLLKIGKLVSYPNPANDIVTIQLPQYVENNVDITIRNLLGKTIFAQLLLLDKKRDVFQIDISDLMNGAYILEVRAKGISESTKLVVQKN